MKVTIWRNAVRVPAAEIPPPTNYADELLDLLRPDERGDLRRKLQVLEEETDAQCEVVAALMHERNAQPGDGDVAARLQEALEARKRMEREYAELTSWYHCPAYPMPSEDALDVLGDAKRLLR